MVDPADLAALIDYRLREVIESGHPPVDVAAWRRAAERRELANERDWPGFIARAAAGVRIRADGRRVTGWREVRGSNGMDWVYDPTGADRAPDGYSIERAKAEYDERRKRQRPADKSRRAAG